MSNFYIHVEITIRDEYGNTVNNRGYASRKDDDQWKTEQTVAEVNDFDLATKKANDLFKVIGAVTDLAKED